MSKQTILCTLSLCLLSFESSLYGLCSWIYYHMHMMWSDVFLVRFEFVEGVIHGGELTLLYLGVL
jgi:hypothetical protein